MRHLLVKIAAMLFIAWTLSLMINTESKAQSKRNPNKVTQIDVNSKMGSIEINGVSLDLHDLTGQWDLMEYHRMMDELEGNDPRNPKITFLKDETLGPRSYRWAETLEEAAREEDGSTVLKFDYNMVRDNIRKRFN